MMVSRSCIVAAMVRAFSSLGPGLSQRHSQHFFHRHHTVQHLLQRVLPERLHPLSLRHLADLRGRRVPDDEIAELLRHWHDLVDGHATLHAREAAGRAPLAPEEADLAQPLWCVAVGHEGLLVGLVWLLAVLAHAATEPLR